MNVSRNFMLIGALFLIIGVIFGMYMGGSGDHSFAPLHAHINLLGFTLMTIFGLTYRLIPAMAEGMLATLHFWLHTVGTTVMVIMLYLMFSGAVSDESGIMMIMPIAELAVFVGIVIYGWNVLKRA